jgi:hypothetical protein
MISKKGQLLSLKITFAILVFLLVDLIYLGYKFNYSKNLTGFSVKTSVIDFYSQIPPISRFLLIAQWAVLVIVILFMVIKDKRTKSDDKKIIKIDIKENYDKKKTDLDVLYDILKKEKSLKLSTISRSFGIDKEIAMEWCKILESGNLVMIDYPGFGEPTIKVLDKSI